MTNHPAPAAVLVAPLTGQFCRLEGHMLTLRKRGYEIMREVWVRPNSLAAVIEARRKLFPGWSLQETYEIAPWDRHKWIGF